MSTTESAVEEPITASFGAVYIKDPLKRRKCPLCNQNLHLYNLNFEEMMLMCENEDCDYPFGYEALQVVSDEAELRDNPVAATAEFSMYPANEIPFNLDTVSTTSVIQAPSMLSDTGHTTDSEFGSNLRELDDDTLSVKLRKETRATQRRKDKKRVMDKHIQSIQKLNNEMVQLSSNVIGKQIKKEKWLNTLKTWEASSGKKLLRDVEVKGLKEDSGLGEIKLNVKTGENVPTSIDICLKDVKLNR